MQGAPSPINRIMLRADRSLLGHQVVAWAIDNLARIVAPAGIIVSTDPTTTPDARTLLFCLATSDDADSLPAESYRIEIQPDGATLADVRIAAPDALGFSYALSELAADLAAGTFSAIPGITIERPPVPVRGIARAFSSADEDTPWFHDRGFWTEYLDFLACQRFNRFQLAFGMQFNYGTIDRGLIDNYLAFAYPFLLDVDGYKVRVDGMTHAERARNLDALKFIAHETKRRGIRFQLGLWTHAYAFGSETRHRYPVLGISDDIHADYCAAALSKLLAEIPEIDGLTFRVHFEGGIREANQDTFWGRILDAISAAGRPIEVDMHAKGVGQGLLDAVKKPGIKPMLSGKYWAEHLGLPYHQTSIRAQETARPAPPGETMSTLASYSRLFTRYGYADYLSENSGIDFMFRVWPGTQKLLLWGDPEIAAGYGRHSTFGGSLGVEFCEPLFFKGRKGGSVNRRDPYVRDDLRLGSRDWQKYRYTYLLWGRLLYNPDAHPKTWQRLLRADYGDGAPAAEQGLAALSRILPLLTVVHGVGGANNIYWPEIYVDLPISAWVHSDHYDKHYEWDNSAPQNWGRVSPFDPKLFYTINDYARDALAGTIGAKYTPLEVAGWIDEFVATGERAIAELKASAGDNAQTLRTLIDLEVLARLGRFFAGKFRAAVDYALFEASGDPATIASAVAHYEKARDAYADIVPVVDGVYQDDLVFGTELSEHGHWSMRIRDIDADLRALRLERDRATGEPKSGVVQHRTSRTLPADIQHQPAIYERGRALPLSLTVPQAAGIKSVILHYRHVDQSQQFREQAMDRSPTGFEATIADGYTASDFPLMYFFELSPEDGLPLIYPGLNASLSNQPYFMVQSTQWRPRG